MEVKFLSVAEKEFLDTVSYYNFQKKGLGYEFAAEIKKTIGRIIQYPKAWPELSTRTRRCITNRFPYGVIYQLDRDIIFIIAVMHLSRKPQIWKNGLKNRV